MIIQAKKLNRNLYEVTLPSTNYVLDDIQLVIASGMVITPNNYSIHAKAASSITYYFSDTFAITYLVGGIEVYAYIPTPKKAGGRPKKQVTKLP